MVFSSMSFVYLFLPIFLVLYYMMRDNRAKNALIVFASLIFYAWGEPIYVVLMLVSTLNDYFFSLLIDRVINRDRTLAKFYLVLSIIVNLGLLSYFKYADFLIINLNTLFGTAFKPMNLPLPIGISFYTFQTMSYTIDVFRREVKVQRNFNTLLAYVTLFPQLIAGPIVRYATVEDELDNRTLSIDEIAMGVRRFIVGLGKKIIIANQMALIVQFAFSRNGGTLTFIYAWMGIMALILQIYYDFSGYSDMAIGMGLMMGFHFLENFNAPLRSTSVTEFWDRWHISLGTWFKDYLYIPLGGSRKSKWRSIFNLFIVWFLMGFWHGAEWNYILFGLYFFVLIMLERYGMKSLLAKLPRVLRHVYMYMVFVFGFLLFQTENLNLYIPYVQTLFSPWASNSMMIGTQMLALIPYLILGYILLMPIPRVLQQTKSRFAIIYDGALIGIFLWSTLFLVSGSFNPFIYFRF